MSRGGFERPEWSPCMYPLISSVSHNPELLERQVVLPLPHLPHRFQTGAARRHRRRRDLQHGHRARRALRVGVRTH